MNILNPNRFAGAVVPIPTGNLIFYLRFNNNDDDETGNWTPSQITSTGDYSFVNGIYSGASTEAIEYGSLGTGYTQVNDKDLLSFGDGSTDSPFSASFCMNADNLGTLDGTVRTKFIISKRIGTSYREYQFATSNDTNKYMGLTLWDDSTGGWIRADGGTSLNNSTNYHVVITYDGSSSTSGIKVYINGVAETMTPSSSGTYIAMENGNRPVIIGSADWGGSIDYQGRLDGVAMWNIELSPDEVTAICNKQMLGLELL